MDEIKISEQQPKKQKYFLTAETVLRYLIGSDDKIDTLVMCKPEDVELTTSDFNLYEAMGSIKQYDNVQLNKLTKLLEVVEIVSFRQHSNQEKPILKEERVEELRKMALTITKKE